MTDTLTPQQLFFKQVEKEVAQSPMLHLLFRSFSNRQDIIYRMKEERPEDGVLLDFISNSFGIHGGGSLNPSGWYEYKGGQNPLLEIQDRQFKVIHKLEGKQLVSAFRSVFKIPAGNQLELF